MKFRNSFLPITVILLIFGHFSISNAYAYLDPGTGSIILLSIIGPLVGAGLAIKIYWQKIKMRFTK
jgi:hypothetical protein